MITDDYIHSKESCSSREIRELSLLFEISQQLNESLDLNIVFQSVLKMMAQKMGIVRGALTILNRKTGEIVLDEGYGLLPEEQAKGKYLPGEGITGKVVETGTTVIVPRISEEPQFLDRTGSRREFDTRELSFICVPVKIGAEVIGALSIDRYYEGSSTLSEDAQLLSIIASCLSQAVRLRQLAQEELEKLKDENLRLHEELKDRHAPKSIIGTSKTMRNVYSLIEKVSAANTTVLILGESGVGKEKVAQAIHFGSPRADLPFVKFNCAALPESLVESELFGHEKGSFTGANMTRKGRFESADGGTIFLDEIGELSLPVQAKLLRILQEREFERIGGNQTIRVNVRIIAATNRDLESLISEGHFREDLYYRLNVFPIVVPPLRERKTDIILLADCFIDKFSREQDKEVKRISSPAVDMLVAHHWPGNVRELENCIERAVLLANDGVIHSYNLPPSIQTQTVDGNKAKGSLSIAIERVEREIIIEELQSAKGNMSKAAKALGISERIMGLRVTKYGIDTKRYK
jgi:Nif-specific regulatory protein